MRVFYAAAGSPVVCCTGQDYVSFLTNTAVMSRWVGVVVVVVAPAAAATSSNHWLEAWVSEEFVLLGVLLHVGRNVLNPRFEDLLSEEDLEMRRLLMDFKHTLDGNPLARRSTALVSRASTVHWGTVYCNEPCWMTP